MVSLVTCVIRATVQHISGLGLGVKACCVRSD